MERKRPGPDQARSWAIAMSGCVINSLLTGINRSTGLFYVAFIETYGVSRMEANIPFTVRNAVANLGGPLAGAIGQRYGSRNVTFIGGIFASLGIILCTFASNITWICVLWGGIHGLGVALGNTLTPIIINQYFLKYRATASGLSLSGSCIGSFILPIVLEYMLNNIGLSGTFLMTGAFIMHVLPAALLMKEPPWIRRKFTEKCKTQKRELFHQKGLGSVSTILKSVKERETSDSILVVSIKKVPATISICDGAKKVEEDNFQSATRIGSVFSQNGVDNNAFDGSVTNVSERNFDADKDEEDFHEVIRMRTVSTVDTRLSFSLPASEEIQETSITKGMIKMLRNPIFHIIGISFGGFAILLDTTVVVIVDYIKDKGLQENDAKYFILIMALGDLVGKLCFGWVIDRSFMSPPKFMMLLQVVQGICFYLMPLFHTFHVLMTLIFIFGLASGATLVMFPILVSKYLSSVQSLAIGFTSVFTGVVSFAVPPLIGYFRDYAGSYEGLFAITGSLSLVAGCLWLFEPLLTRSQKSHHAASVENNSNQPPPNS